MNVYAKFRNFPLRINKALGIFRIGVTRTSTRTTRVAIRDAFQLLIMIAYTGSNAVCVGLDVSWNNLGYTAMERFSAREFSGDPQMG